jgi:hypothetical protein
LVKHPQVYKNYIKGSFDAVLSDILLAFSGPDDGIRIILENEVAFIGSDADQLAILRPASKQKKNSDLCYRNITIVSDECDACTLNIINDTTRS